MSNGGPFDDVDEALKKLICNGQAMAKMVDFDLKLSGWIKECLVADGAGHERPTCPFSDKAIRKATKLAEAHIHGLDHLEDE